MGAGGRRDLLLVALLALAPVVALAPAWSGGLLLAPGEGTALHLPLRVEAWRAVDRGEVPSWNPTVFSGTPLLASYHPGALHPLMVALTPLAPFTAFQCLVLVSLALVGPLGFACARRMGAGPVGALVAGLGFTLGPALVGGLDDTAMLVAAPALPLLLLAVEAHLTQPRAARAASVAGAAALVLLAGSTDAVGAAALLLAARLAVAAVAWDGGDGPRGRRVWGVVAALGAGILLAAPQLVPTLMAYRAAGPADTAGPGPAPVVLAGVTGLVLHFVSHTPAPLFALAAVPLLRTHPVLRAPALVVGLSMLLLAADGRPAAAGGVRLALDLALALLGGLSLSVQWQLRGETHGRRLRLLTAIVALGAAAVLSVVTTVTGPLPQGLASPLGLLALALILYVLLAGSPRPVAAHVFLLPLVASFLLQPWGRQAWAGAPTAVELEEGTPTRRALDRVMGPRRGERTLSLVETRLAGPDRDLAAANGAVFAGRRNVDGYDPHVPASRRRALEGMRGDGTLPRSFLATDPGRLELLGVRWVQVPTSSLTAPVDAQGLGDALDVVLEPPRPRVFALPFTGATEVRIASFLAGSTHVPQGEIVAECVALLASGHRIWLPIRAGVETAEWAWERPDVREEVRHQRAPILRSHPVRDGFLGHQYLGVLRLPGRFAVVGLRFKAYPDAPPLWLLRVGLRDAETGRATGVGASAGYLSDEARLRLAAQTPRVTLFEVQHGIGPAWVVPTVRSLPDEEHVFEVLGAPTHLGVDSRHEALVVEVGGEPLVLPPGGRSSEAVVARARGGRVVVRAVGPGLLVLAEGWDPGWQVRVDGARRRVVRVNGDRLGVVLGAGPHRIVFRHHAPGLRAGLGLALVGALGLAAAGVRERRLRRRARSGRRV